MAFEPAVCPKDCVYRTTINGGIPMCGYLHITGELRGCDPGTACKKYSIKRTHEKPFKNRITKWDTQTGRKMWAEGYSDAQIAKKLGTRRETVARYRERNWGRINRERQKRT